MNREMTIEYLKCRAGLNFEVDFTVNGVIGTIVIKWDLKVLEKCTKNLIGHSRLAFNNHESNIDY